MYTIANHKSIEIIYNDNSNTSFDALIIDAVTSKKMFARTGEINHIIVHVLKSELK